MIEENQSDHSPRRKKSSRRTGILPYFLAICGVIACLFVYFRFLKPPAETVGLVEQPAGQSGGPTDTADRQREFSLEPSGSEQQAGSETRPETADENSLTGVEPLDSHPESSSIAERITLDSITLTDQDYGRALTGITSFYDHLDQQPYLRESQLGAPSSVYFSRLIQKMLDTPPIVTGETADLFSIIKNTSHFFRVIGKDDILTLKTVISREKSSYEELLADFYALSHRPEALRREFAIELKEDSLYDYAGFFLTTMGGRLYLFRRDASLRMLVSYYSILIVEEANRLGKNRHGIDVRPVVEQLISEMENSGSQLTFKEHYLDNLYNLKEKYL